MLRWAVNCTQWTPNKQEWLSGLGCLQREEVDRVGRFVYQRDSKLALVGRLLIRAALCQLLGLSNIEIRLTRSDKGKPLLIRDDGIERGFGFNVSHQGDFCVLAAQQGSSVGVDVMQFSQPRGTSVSQFFKTMSRQFTPIEWEQIEASNTAHLANFYRFWCLKESFIKAEGTGLSYGLQNLQFLTNPSLPWPPDHYTMYTDSSLAVRGQTLGDWHFEESLLDNQHCVAVATQTVSTELFTKITVPQLLQMLSAYPTQHLEQQWTVFTSKTQQASQC